MEIRCVKMVKYPVFLSCPKPFMKSQEEFLVSVEEQLRANDLEPRTLGRSDYDMDAPLEGIRRLMVGCCGLIALTFRRTFIEKGTERLGSDNGGSEVSRDGSWLTSPYCHIEPAMAFQIGLPLLLWRESGVLADGALDRGAMGASMPEFDLTGSTPDLDHASWRQPFRIWMSRVEAVYRNRGAPPRLY
jgi:hypothetical protein